MNFALILLILVVVTGIAWVAATSWCFSRNGAAPRTAAVAEFDRQQERIGERFADEHAAQTRARLRDDKLREPWWVEYPTSFFPVILVVFLLRSFLAEPFKIPSASMGPTLEVGDFILVNKFAYGIRLPIIKKKIIRSASRQARRRRGVPLSGRPVARLHQARGRRAGRQGRLSRQAAHDQRQAGAARRRQPDYFDDERFGYCEAVHRRRSTARTTRDRSNNPQAPPVVIAHVRTSRTARIATTMTQASPARCRRATTS